MEYKILKKNIFSKGNYSIAPIRSEDRYVIMRWRNEQIYHLRQSEPLTEEDQNHYFDTVVAKLFHQSQPNQLLFSYLEDNRCIGYGGLVHINWLDKNAEISFIIETSLEKNQFGFHWGVFLDLIEQVALDELGLHKLYTYAFDLRPHLYEAIEAKGYIKEAILKEHCCFNGVFKNVVIHSKINKAISIRRATMADLHVVYDWANDEITRANSFFSEPIAFETHKNWWFEKINDVTAVFYICEVGRVPAGIVRFDKEDIEKSYTIGINIAPNYRGRRLSVRFLKATCFDFLKTRGDYVINAYIKKDNIASIRIFEKAHFKYVGKMYKGSVNSLKFQLNTYEK